MSFTTCNGVTSPIRVVGTQYTKSLGVVANLRVGEHLGLVKEPVNEYDANAIGVYYGRKRIGYIEKACSRELNSKLGPRSYAIVAQVDTRLDPYNQLRVVVYGVTDKDITRTELVKKLGRKLASKNIIEGNNVHTYSIYDFGVVYGMINHVKQDREMRVMLTNGEAYLSYDGANFRKQ